eukprot:TRINITY_DN8448_c0_g1_i3.p1 TRINITY_DN8448_c0_g1~~TRINITY_DN8448_c0_g1_i3.p1  ORF type:complete len:1140 (+),score=294.48 TRINITY_DN8448_c0_g1_i3:208-3420(+)
MDFYSETWGEPRSQLWHISGKQEGQDVLTRDALELLLSIAADVYEIEADVSDLNINLDKVTLRDVCEEPELPKEAFSTIVEGSVYSVLIFPQILEEETEKTTQQVTEEYAAIVAADIMLSHPNASESEISELIRANMTSESTETLIQTQVNNLSDVTFTAAYERLFDPTDTLTSQIPIYQTLQLSVAHLAPATNTYDFWRFPCMRTMAIDCFAEGGFDYLYPPVEQPVRNLGAYDLRQLLELGGLPNFFEEKPSFREISDEEIKSVLKDGCSQFANVLLPPNAILGGVNSDWTKGEALRSIISVGSSKRIVQKIKHHKSLDISENHALEIALRWEKSLIDYLSVRSNEMTNSGSSNQFRLTFMSARSSSDALSDAAQADFGLIVSSYVLMFFYAIITVLRYPDMVHSRGLLAIFGVCLVMLGVLAALGLASFLGIPFSPISTQVLPFLALGIGVDDLFVMLSTSETSGSLSGSHTDFTVAMLVRSGPSITLTGISNTFAFLLGSLTPIDAVRFFTLQSAIVMMVNYFVLIFALTACISYDFDRISQKKNCLCPCIGESRGQAPDFSVFRLSGSAALTSYYSVLEGLRMFAGNYYAPFLMKKPIKIAVLLIFSVIFSVACYGISDITLGLSLSDVTPTTSYLYDFLVLMEKYFFIWPGELIVQNDDHASERVQTAIFSAQNNLMNLTELYKDTSIQDLSWFSGLVTKICLCHGILQIQADFQETPSLVSSGAIMSSSLLPQGCFDFIQSISLPVGPLQGTQLVRAEYFAIDVGQKSYFRTEGNVTQIFIPADYKIPEKFFDLYAKVYFDTVGIASKTNAIFVDEKLRSSKTTMILTDLSSSSEFTNAIKRTRGVTNSENAKIYPYGTAYLYWEQYLHIEQILAQNLSLALFAVFLCVWGFLMSLPMAGILLLVMGSTLLEILGFMGFLGMSLNAVPVVNLIMATGVTVEFTVHLAYAFLKYSHPTKDARVVAALREMFAPILHGGVSTFLGVALIAFSVNHYFVIYFFRMYVLMITLGLANGLVLLPVVLSLIGPAPFRRSGVEVDSRRDNLALFGPLEDRGSDQSVEIDL